MVGAVDDLKSSQSRRRPFPNFEMTKPEERTFVVDSKASLRMLSRKDLNSAELDTVRVSRNPGTGITANGDVQTNEEANSVRLRSRLFRDSTNPRGYASSSIAWKTPRRSRTFLWWSSGQTPHLVNKRQKIQCNTENYVPIVVPSLSTGTSILRQVTPNKQKTKIRTWIQHWETGCMICQKGWISLKI